MQSQVFEEIETIETDNLSFHIQLIGQGYTPNNNCLQKKNYFYFRFNDDGSIDKIYFKPSKIINC